MSHLNIWTGIDRTTKRPVFVWIHGGGFGGGSGAIPIYNGTKLAAQGVVVVTINYRVGPFGFLAHPELTREANGSGVGNYGLQDMIAALRWVRDNIEAFGGDPANVTVAGQSAGAIAVNDLLVSPAAKGLFARAIAQSGSGMGISAIPLAKAEDNGQRLAQLLGALNLAALRALPPEQIQAKLPTYFGPSPKNAPPRIEFRPVLDGAVVPVDPVDGTARPVSNVPLLTGFNADEFMPERDMTREQFKTYVNERYGKHGERLLALYPHSTDAEAASSARALIRDGYMASLWSWSRNRTKSSGALVYAYLFTHPMPVARPPSYGTHHTSEIPYLFGVLDRSLRPFTDADDRVAAQLQTYWVNFLRTGDPNEGSLPKWAPVDERAIQVMGLGDDPGAREPTSSRARFDALMAYVADGGRLSIR